MGFVTQRCLRGSLRCDRDLDVPVKGKDVPLCRAGDRLKPATLFTLAEKMCGGQASLKQFLPFFWLALLQYSTELGCEIEVEIWEFVYNWEPSPPWSLADTARPERKRGARNRRRAARHAPDAPPRGSRVEEGGKRPCKGNKRRQGRQWERMGNMQRRQRVKAH